MTGRLSGKAAIVTGGARGLGLVFVRALLAEGARVLAVDIADIGAAEAAGARAMRADITQAAGEVARACQEASWSTTPRSMPACPWRAMTQSTLRPGTA